MQYHTDSSGPDAAAFRRAFARAIAEASATGVDEVIFLVHSLQMLEGGVFEEVLGEKFVAAFAKNKVAAAQGVRLHLETERVTSAANAAVVFAPFVSAKLLAKAMGDYRTKGLVYVPWAESERDAYAAAYPNSTQI
ncbi:MAG: hypothetical protein JSR86_19860 [Proteobacteria bacterium]|nr:hypothetical protein [Pseudomonadota bacterium]